MNYSDAFSREAIAEALSTERIKAATRRHRLFMPERLLGLPQPLRLGTIDKVMPPRDQWPRPGRLLRGDPRQMRILADHVAKTAGTADSAWARGAASVIGEVQRIALDGGVLKPAPKVNFLPKKPHIYRAVVAYPLVPKVLDRLLTRYLSAALRYAPVQRDDAVRRLIGCRQAHDGVLWVAELDLRSCFDCVHQDYIWGALEVALGEAKQRETRVDQRALELFGSFVDTYSYSGVVEPAARRFLEERDPDGSVSWPREELQAIWGTQLDHIGLPQGASFSALIVELLLRRLDEEVRAISFYERFVDDIVIIHPDRATCEAAFLTCLERLADLGLPVHPPVQFAGYGADHWASKTRAPYPWAKRRVPWVGYLGYQIRWDSVLRIRPDTVDKEMQKLEDEARKLITVFEKAHAAGTPMRSADQVVRSLERRLVRHAVGDAHIDSSTSDSSPCWANAFRLLREYAHLDHQLRALDRKREQEVLRVARALDANRRMPGGLYYGAPFSYAGQLRHPGTRA